MNRSYFNSFVLPLSDNMFQYSKCLLGNENEAFDLVEYCMLYWWDKRKELGRENLVVRVMQKIRSEAKDRIKQRKKAARPFLNKEWEQGDWESIQMTHSENVEDLIACLPELHAEILCLRSVGRFNEDEICLITGLGFNNVRSILADARKAIRKGLGSMTEQSFTQSELWEKYYSGTSTLDEEQQLRLHYNKEEHRISDPAGYALFHYFMSLHQAEMPDVQKRQIEEKVHKMQSSGWFMNLIDRIGMLGSKY